MPISVHIGIVEGKFTVAVIKGGYAEIYTKIEKNHQEPFWEFNGGNDCYRLGMGVDQEVDEGEKQMIRDLDDMVKAATGFIGNNW